MKQHYKTLGISENSSLEDAIKAAKRIMQANHPDKGESADTELFIKAKKAIEEIKKYHSSDKKKTEKYTYGDTWTHDWNDWDEEYYSEYGSYKEYYDTPKKDYNIKINPEYHRTGGNMSFTLDGKHFNGYIPQGILPGQTMSIENIGKAKIVFDLPKEFEISGTTITHKLDIGIIELYLLKDFTFTSLFGETYRVKEFDVNPSESIFKINVNNAGLDLGNGKRGNYILIVNRKINELSSDQKDKLKEIIK